MRRRSISPVTLVLIGVALMLAVGAGWFLAKRSSNGPAGPAAPPVYTDADGRRVIAHLYFGDLQGRYLTSEQRVLNRPDAAAAYARLLIDKLIEGPNQGGSRTLPETARVRALFVGGDGVAYVDFNEDAF